MRNNSAFNFSCGDLYVLMDPFIGKILIWDLQSRIRSKILIWKKKSKVSGTSGDAGPETQLKWRCLFLALESNGKNSTNCSVFDSSQSLMCGCRVRGYWQPASLNCAAVCLRFSWVYFGFRCHWNSAYVKGNLMSSLARYVSIRLATRSPSHKLIIYGLW